MSLLSDQCAEEIKLLSKVVGDRPILWTENWMEKQRRTQWGVKNVQFSNATKRTALSLSFSCPASLIWKFLPTSPLEDCTPYFDFNREQQDRK